MLKIDPQSSLPLTISSKSPWLNNNVIPIGDDDRLRLEMSREDGLVRFILLVDYKGETPSSISIGMVAQLKSDVADARTEFNLETEEVLVTARDNGL